MYINLTRYRVRDSDIESKEHVNQIVQTYFKILLNADIIKVFNDI